MRVLVTGGVGNIARYCAAELLAHGHEPVLFARTRPEDARNPWSSDAPTLLGDLTSAADCRRAALEGAPEVVLHLGAMTYPTDDQALRRAAVERGHEPPSEDETARVNLLGTFNVLTAAVDAGARSVVFGSTVSILHSSANLAERLTRVPIDESQPVWPTDSYALSKRLGEQMLEAFTAASGIQTISLRLEWTFFHHAPVGIEMDNPPVGIAAAGLDDFPLAYWQYIDARDAAAGCRLAVEDDHPGRSEVFFIATDRTTIEPHVELLERFQPQLAAGASMAADDLVVSIGRIRDRLGYAPGHSWRRAPVEAS